MPCPHFSIKISSRSKHAVVAQAAYQSGERLFDERNNRTRSYTEKTGMKSIKNEKLKEVKSLLKKNT